MYRTVIWATDGYAGADTALGEAVALVEASRGRLVAVHCDQRLRGRGGSWPALADEDDRRVKIRRQVAALRARGIDADVVIRRTYKEPAEVVARIAVERDADVIVCSTRGFGVLAGTLVGSFAQRLPRVARCPVLVVPEHERRDGDPAGDPAEVGA